ncbi:MAG: class C beta-lactamase-related serine hydrolase [Rhodospirillaceae bacterium]|nr:MAG: class C beta-lactamase-related serine hydrolase [Rhodospirillaceae bacterium]
MTPDRPGFSADVDRKLAAGIQSGLLRGLHAVLVSQGGSLILERYDDGLDQNWGQPLGHVSFGPDVLHDLRSVTKSIVGLLYGIALDRGLVPSMEAPLLPQFPEYPDLAADPRRMGLKVEHALTMTMGLAWDESLPYTDPANSEIAMELAGDRCRFSLDRPIVAEPGSQWIYSGGCVALVGALIERGTGKTLPAFAREALFDPLGITSFQWSAGRDGVALAASGLRLCSRDLLRIGEMLIAKGRWRDRRIISESWLAASFKPAISTGDGLHYGRLWFLGDAPAPAFGGNRPWMAGFGNGGQRLWLMPDAGLAAVIFSGNYDQPDASISPTRVWREIVLANLHAAEFRK